MNHATKTLQPHHCAFEVQAIYILTAASIRQPKIQII